jgi:hypothetical protein
MARDPADARRRPMMLRPRYRLAEAPAAVLAWLQAGARAEGHRTWADRWRCRACAVVWPWQDVLAGEVEGSAFWLPLCPTAGCAGIGWLHFEGV